MLTGRDTHVLPPGFRITSEVLWRGTLLFAALDAAFVPLLVWRIGRLAFHRYKWALFATAAVFWCSLWIWALGTFWDSVYHYVFPAWARYVIPPGYGLLFAGVGLSFWWLAQRLPGSPVASYCVLGGLWGVITHLWAVHLGIVEKPPLLQGAAPMAAVTVAMFEFMFYWCLILSFASLLHHGWRRLRKV